MATLVLVLKTVGEAWEDFDVYTKQHLLQSAQTKEEIEVVKTNTAFSPFTGRIVSVALYDIERGQGAVYCVGDATAVHERVGDFIIKKRTEKEILEDVWEGVRGYDVFVTFNGRAFAVPFLIHRSLIHGVRPSYTFAQSRYLSRQSLPYHVDLMDEFSMYGAMSKRPSLHLLLRAHGIDSSRVDDGSQVAELVRTGKCADLTYQSVNDVIATTALYEKWKQHLAPASFLNAIEL